MVALAVLEERLDTMNLEGFSNLGDSKIPFARPGEVKPGWVNFAVLIYEGNFARVSPV